MITQASRENNNQNQRERNTNTLDPFCSVTDHVIKTTKSFSVTTSMLVLYIIISYLFVSRLSLASTM